MDTTEENDSISELSNKFFDDSTTKGAELGVRPYMFEPERDPNEELPITYKGHLKARHHSPSKLKVPQPKQPKIKLNTCAPIHSGNISTSLCFRTHNALLCHTFVRLLNFHNVKEIENQGENTLSLFACDHLFLCEPVCVLSKPSNILDGQIGQGGASPHTGGRDERPPRLSGPGAKAPSPVPGRWIPPSSVKRDVQQNPEESKYDFTFRKVRGILNKLTPEKFDKLSLELLNVGIDTDVILKGIILLIFEKALDEPKYSNLYAQLCHQLCENAPNFEPPASNTSTFRRLLLSKCQDEFENRSKASEVFDRKDGPLNEEELEQYHLVKRKMLGNIKFIGELGKLEMLHETILHKCIKQLLEKKKNVPVSDMAEDLECLCQIMKTVGRRLDTDKAKSWMDQYFSRMKVFANSNELPSRIRFMLQDVMDLRENEWKPRENIFDKGPRTITQIRKEAADEFGDFYSQGGKGNRGQMNGALGPQWMGGISNGNMGDFFGMPMSGMMMGSTGTGTGPGVIHDMPGFPPNMGKNRNMQQGFINYNKNRQDNMGGSGGGQRGYKQNNQQNGRQSPQQQQAKTATTRDLPPRFARLAQQQQQQIAQQAASANGTAVPIPVTSSEEISLRPAKNFTPMFKPMVPGNLPRSAQGGPPVGSSSSPLSNMMNNVNLGPPEPPKPLLNKQANITIKQEKEKPKPNKKAVPSKEDVLRASISMLEDFMSSIDTNEALNAFKEMNAPKKYIPNILSEMMCASIDKSDTERSNVMKLISAMKTENFVSSDQFMESFQAMLEKMADLETDVPLVKSYMSQYGALGVIEQVVSLQELSAPLENGAYYPLFLLCLQNMCRIKDKNWLVTEFNDSKLDLQKMLPEIDQSKERMMEILEDRGLSFMFPLLRIQSELWKHIQEEPSATAVFKWVKDKVDSSLHHTSGFIHVLATSILKYITKRSTLADGIDTKSTPEKTAIEQEKQALDKLKGVLQMFLHDHMDLQISTLYAVQVFCNNHDFPKGMLLRMFVNFYDMEIVEEESFLKWREEVNDEYPGKGKALFQVNQWLTWLEMAEEESDEDDE